MYDYYCTIERVLDGDTVDIDIDVGFGIVLKSRRVRIAGIDAPETRTRNLVEKQFGLASKKRAEELLPVGSTQILLTELDRDGDVLHGKFGRILADFKIGETCFTEIMLKEGHAVPYDGASREAQEELMLANRKKLLESGVVTLDPDFK